MSAKRFFKNIKKNKPSRGKKNESPSNSRIIPASAKASSFANASADRSAGKPESFKFQFSKINSAKFFKLYRGALKVFVVFIFIATAIVVGQDFLSNLQIKKDIDSQREILTEDLKLWEDFISKNQNYPDAYFQASILEYKLGDTAKAKMYAEKGLALDPNSENGRKIDKLLDK